MLQSFNTGGFAMTFENGLTLSVMFGVGNLGSNEHRYPRQLKRERDISAYSAQVSINDANKVMYIFPLDGLNIQGYVNADGVAEWIKAVQKATSLKDIVEPENV